MNDADVLVRFWAKTSSRVSEPMAFHPLICHLIDVAAVTRKVWSDVLPTAAKIRIARAFGETMITEGTTERIGRIIAFIAGLHDLGKCSPPFIMRGKQIETQKTSLECKLEGQTKKSSEYAIKLHKQIQTINFLDIYEPTDFRVKEAVPLAKDAPHGYVTTIELPQILVRSRFGFNPKLAEQISVLIGGHHGVFPNSEWRKKGKKAIVANLGNEHWEMARIKLSEILADLFNIERFVSNEGAKLDNGTIMILAGLVSIADWIGSDEQFFKCAVKDYNDIKLSQGTLDNYLIHAESQATKALRKLGWLDWTEYGHPKEFERLFPFEPRGSQIEAVKIAKEIELSRKAGIFVVEDQMGNGKTESAMLLADTLNSVLGQRGIYFALPTQATTNQMFGRVRKFLSERFGNGLVQTQLLHGHATLSSEFQTLKDDFKNLQDIYEECSGDDCVPHVVAAEWFTYRKRGLLAPFGVGTVDQALMAVLQTKHVFVRLFGLAHKTVIIDEVHAYDAYMSTLLERLLEWLAALGSPVILLSATLPRDRRDALIKAYQRGIGIKESVTEGPDSYPRISYATDSTINVRHIESSHKTQTLNIKRVEDEGFVNELKTKLDKDGGCAAIICNTVQRAQDTYDRLSKDAFFADKLDLLHSRFRFRDREIIENRVLRRFGKPEENGGSPHRPSCSVLISTQIIEQSLDLDFDLMISDLAPIDLLLQRAGRLHRHDRPRKDEFKIPTLWIIDPKTDEMGLPDFDVHKFVYDEHILLRTWLILRETEMIKIPNEIERLIEGVYDFRKAADVNGDHLDALWAKTLARCLKDIASDAEQAANRYIKRPSYGQELSGIFTGNLEEDSPDIHKTLQAATRLTEPTVSTVCLWGRAEKTFIDEDLTREVDLNEKPNLDLTKELLRHTVSVSSKSVVFGLLAEKVPVGWRGSALLRHHRILKLDENGSCEKFGYVFRLNTELGLTVRKNEDNV